VTAVPCQENRIDLIGPWKVMVQGIAVEFLSLTMFDPVTNVVELTRIENKTAGHVAQQYVNVWLSRYPWPEGCVHDNGGVFIGLPFQRLLEQCTIRSRATSARNPQANAICERMHQTVGNILRTLLHGEPVTTHTTPDIVDNSLATTMHALRVSVPALLIIFPQVNLLSIDICSSISPFWRIWRRYIPNELPWYRKIWNWQTEDEFGMTFSLDKELL
jgi:hypothetical protein